MPSGARFLAALTLAAASTLACSSSDVMAPEPTSVDPSVGYGGNATPVVIHGTGFEVRITEPSSGGEATVDSQFRAWLGSAELSDVEWIDFSTLQATVPAGLPVGSQTLVVEGPFHSRGALPDAFLVSLYPAAFLSASLAVDPATATVGQTVQVALTVVNTGSEEAAELVPGVAVTSTDGATLTAVSGPSPPSYPSLPPGGSAVFTWTFQVTAPGTLSCSASVRATDPFSGQAIGGAPVSPVVLAVQSAPALAASFATPRSVAVESDFTVRMTVTNTGEALALAVAPAALAFEPGSPAATLLSGPTPPTADVPGNGGSITFSWTFEAGSAEGTLGLSGAASGLDANSGTAVTTGPVISGPITIGNAALLASLAATPATVGVGQSIALVLTLANPGTVAVTNVVPGVPVVSGSGTVGAPAGPTPSVIPSLAPSGTATFTWMYTASADGDLNFSASATGVDSASGATIDATAELLQAVVIEGSSGGSAALAVSGFAANPTKAKTKQAINISLTLANSGTESAVVSAVMPTVTPSGDTCTAAGPAPPATLGAGATVTFSWKCTATSANTYTLGAAVTAADTTGANVSPTVEPITLIVSK